MIVSIAIAVLPVWRSPMISSRWPRPIGIIESIAFRPVCIGSLTGWRWTTPGALNSAGRVSVVSIVALAVERVAERVDDAAEQRLADRDLEQVAGALDRVALDDLLPVAEQHGADVVGLEVQRQAGDAVRQLEHLERHAVLEAVDAGDAVGRPRARCRPRSGRPAGVEALDAGLEDAGDLVGLDLHVVAFASLRSRPMRARPACEVVRDGCGWRRRGSSCRRGRRCRRGSSGRPRVVSSTLRPVCSADLVADAAGRSPSSSSTALVIVTGRSLFASLPERSYSRRTRKMTGMRWFSTSSSRKLIEHRVGAVDRAVAARPASPRSRSTARRRTLQLAVLVERVGELRRAARGRRRACPAPGRPRTASARRPGRSLPWASSGAPRRSAREKSSSPSASSTSRCWSSSVERLARDLLGRQDRQVGDLACGSPGSRGASRPRCRGASARAAPRAWRCASSSDSRSCASPVLRARATISSACARASLSRSRYSREQLVGLLARALGGVDRVLDRLLALVERLA